MGPLIVCRRDQDRPHREHRLYTQAGFEFESAHGVRWPELVRKKHTP